MNRKKFGRNRHIAQGFTLMELTVYVGLLSILLVIVSQFFLMTMYERVSSEKISNVTQDGAYILARMAYDIRRASSISVPVLNESGSTLVFVANENGVPTEFEYTVSGGNMVLQSSVDASSLNSLETRIRSFTVTRNGNAAVSGHKDAFTIVVTVESVASTSAGIRQKTFSTTVSMR